MNDTIIVGLITGAVSLAICLINNHFQNKRQSQKYDETINLIDYKLTELSKRADKHNNVIERTFKIEEHEAVIDEKLKVINHRIDNLEGSV